MSRALIRWSIAVLLRMRLSRSREDGYAAVLVAIIVPTVGIGCAAVAVDVGNWYVQLERLQNAADAAATAGVPYLPQDLVSARTRAQEVAARNGYDNSQATANGHVPNTVTVALGDKPTQLKVTISTDVVNEFGQMIGVGKESLTRTAVADYQGPAPMGSPCNTFGNEPNAGNANASSNSGSSPVTLNGTGSGTAQSAATQSYCSRTPTMWATVEGPQTGKLQGDRYQTVGCEATGVDGCTGTSNDEYDDFGYVFVVKVAAGAVGKAVDLQLFDPMFVSTKADCSYLPTRSTILSGTSGWNAAKLDSTKYNPYVTYADAASRYSKDASSSATYGSSGQYCTGDAFPGAGSGSSTPKPLTTSFVLRQQVDSQNPTTADVVKDTNGDDCISQYGSYSNGKSGAVSTTLLNDDTSSYNDDVAATLHNWISFCTFTPARAGDYYLQVRTNVSLSGTSRSAVTGTTRNLIKTGNTAALSTTGNTTTGEGSNSFAIRASLASGYEQYVSVSGYNHMPIYINADAATATFHLIRVLPGAAGQKISFSFFDAGDATGSGTVQVLAPEKTLNSGYTGPTYPASCTSYGGYAGGSQAAQATLSNCSTTISSSTNNGTVQTITIPVPTDYTCSFAASSGCWYKVKVSFASGTSVTDVTTWDATVVGDPVRLIQ